MASAPTAERPARRELRYQPHPKSVGEARRKLLELAAVLVDRDRLVDLRLVITEVVSNAVRHGDASEPIVVGITPGEGFFCVAVTDAGPGLAPRLRPTGPDEEGGWGFLLIEQLSRRWGLTREDCHTCVWFEFDFRAREVL